MFTFKKNYFYVTAILFLAEICIALFVNDRIIRPYFGDFLVVILLYTFLKSFFEISFLHAAFSVLLFAYFIEVLQVSNLAGLPWLEKKQVILVVVGSHFEWYDILAYTLGTITIIGIEKFRENPEPAF